MQCPNPQWISWINSCKPLRDYLDRIENQQGITISLADIHTHPTPTLISGLLGTIRETPEGITIYIDARTLSSTQFCHTVIHEIIHWEMDKEGYPVTTRKPAFINDPQAASLGTAIQEVVLHYELNKRQKANGLLIIPINDPLSAFLQGVQGLSTAQITQITNVLNSIGSLSPQVARQCIRNLIHILNAGNRLDVTD